MDIYLPLYKRKPSISLVELKNELISVFMGRPLRPKGRADKRKQHAEIKKPKATPSCWMCGRPTKNPSGICDKCL